MQYYEDQQDAALLRAVDYRRNRLPKYLSYFERILQGESSEVGTYLYGGNLSYADLVLFHTLDGLQFAFPKCMNRLHNTGEYRRVFSLHQTVKDIPRIRNYLASERRQPYGRGLYRHYTELDDPDTYGDSGQLE